MSEAIDNGRTGYVCMPRDLENWCKRLRELITNPQLRLAAGSNAKLDAQQRFSLEIMARDTANVYRDVIGGYQK
jgi:glycosyltransferase involved in cell wall biosynthesis